MERELISVIVPVYNVEKYVSRCLDSLLKQTYSNLEVVVIDDGSPDGSGDICDRYGLNYPDIIRVFHKNNGGVSDARNYGVKKAKGEYIIFVDSDDYVANNYVEYLYTALIENDCDISTCSKVISSSDNVTFDDQDTVCVQSMDGKACCKALLTSDIYDDLVTAWGKVYRRKIIEDTPFPVGHIHEDEAVTPIIMYSARKVLYSNRRLYCYFVNEESIMHTRGTKKNLDAIWAMKSRAEYFDEKGEIELSRLSWEKLYSYLMLDSINYAGRCDEELRVNITKSRVSRKVYYCLLIYRLCPRIYKLIWKSTHKR